MLRKKVGSPLTDHLGSHFGGHKQKKKRVIIGAALLLLVPYLGSTLAASVTISGTGTATAIEFGQGNQVAITCDTTITTTINESWYSTDTIFAVNTIVLSGVNVATALATTANDGGCGGKLMTIRLYSGAAGSATPTIIGNNSATSVQFTVPTATGAITVSGSDGISGTATVTTNVATLTLTLPAGLVNAANITRVSIETDNPT